jgi:hypothetical protein
MCALQAAVGAACAALLWALRLRAAPRLSCGDVKELAPVALWHVAAHVSTVTAFGSSSILLHRTCEVRARVYNAVCVCVCVCSRARI